jgi:hypothetical protein
MNPRQAAIFFDNKSTPVRTAAGGGIRSRCFPAAIHRVRLAFQTLSLFFILCPQAAILHAQAITQLGSADDITILGKGGSGTSPNAALWGFTVFGPPSASYPGPVQGGAGNVVINGYLSVSSGAYFVGGSTLSAGGAYFTGVSSFSDVANIYIPHGGAPGNYVLGKAGSGALQWVDKTALGDNLGNHTATKNINLNGHWLSHSGGNGVYVDGSGNVGIGTTGTGGATLTVNGVANVATSITVNGVTNASVPSGTVAFFTTGSCPANGWTELTAARGLYVVARPSGGTKGTVTGTAFTVIGENRAAGLHTHLITDGGHTHTLPSAYTYTNGSNIYTQMANWAPSAASLTTTIAAGTGISIQNAGSIAGTNAPYMPLIICQKQ